MSFSKMPFQDFRMPMALFPKLIDLLTMARMAAFNPGQSPSPVRTPIVLSMPLLAHKGTLSLCVLTMRNLRDMQNILEMLCGIFECCFKRFRTHVSNICQTFEFLRIFKIFLC